MTQLVLRDEEGLGRGMDRDAGLDERAQHVLRHVLVVERDHVDVAGERQHRLDVVVVADLRSPRGGRDDPSVSASTRDLEAEPTAGGTIIRASWPPPITPTGAPCSCPSSLCGVRTRRAVTGRAGCSWPGRQGRPRPRTSKPAARQATGSRQLRPSTTFLPATSGADALGVELAELGPLGQHEHGVGTGDGLGGGRRRSRASGGCGGRCRSPRGRTP